MKYEEIKRLASLRAKEVEKLGKQASAIQQWAILLKKYGASQGDFVVFCLMSWDVVR